MNSLFDSALKSEIGSSLFIIHNNCKNTHLPQTLVSLPGQLLGTPPGGDALETVALGDANNVNHLVLGEHSGDGNLLLEMVPGEVNLVRHGATVELNLHDVRLLLPVKIEVFISLLN